MKSAFACSVFFCLASIVSANQSLASTLPNCASALSDSDSDGYGWENNASCIVALDIGSCEGRGDYPWGWNPVSETSCRLDHTADTNPIDNAAVDTSTCVDNFLMARRIGSHVIFEGLDGYSISSGGSQTQSYYACTL